MLSVVWIIVLKSSLLIISLTSEVFSISYCIFFISNSDNLSFSNLFIKLFKLNLFSITISREPSSSVITFNLSLLFS